MVLVAVICVLPAVNAKRTQRVEVAKHERAQAHVVRSKIYHSNKIDLRCTTHCAPKDGDDVKCWSSDEWKDICDTWCDQSELKGLCLTPKAKEAAFAKIPDPQAPQVEERQDDGQKKEDDLDLDDLEEEEEDHKPKPKPKPKPAPPPPRKCFPADASVDTPSGTTRMSELRVGDTVRSVNGAGEVFFDEVYFFGHAEASINADYVALKFTDTSLELSNRHFLPTCPEHGMTCDWAQHVQAYAQDVHPGDYVWTASKNGVTLQQVQDSSLISKEGLFNPYTLSGKIVVNNVVASAHSEWILDSLVPSVCIRHLPAVYQAMFLPGRWLYQLVGPNAADMLDVNNPSSHGYGFEFLASFVGICVAGFLAASKHQK
jgi:hypothetical protein